MLYGDIRSPMDRYCSSTCPMTCTLEKLSKKWSLLLLRAFTEERSLRFSEILTALPDINSRILSERLSELEAEGLIKRMVEQTKPITITYDITPKGMDLRKIFEGFLEWQERWEEPVPASTKKR